MDTKEAMERSTARPWSYSVDSCAACREKGEAEYYIPEIGSGYHAPFTNENDVALIVAAVNSFDAGVRLARAVLDSLYISKHSPASELARAYLRGAGLEE